MTEVNSVSKPETVLLLALRCPLSTFRCSFRRTLVSGYIMEFSMFRLEIANRK